MKNTSRPTDRGLLRHRNEPGRFFGDGVSFKAKLIGILEVGEARGDRMCQEALQDLKMAIRAAGEHKQRITIHVTIDGLRLRDEKTGDSLYHHPVHKISFIAQDMTDSRAFGYIFGSPDSGHRFFGIKTDKAASQVVLAMRDLFQVVFELKKKEIELARQHIQSKITAHEHQAVSASLMAKTSATLDSAGGAGCGGGGSYGKNHPSDPLGALGGASSMLAGSSSKSGATGSGATGTLGKSEKSPESVADLVDLEQELSCIQRGITQMERITPSEGPGKSVLDDDPFGDSFANIPPAYNLLPPPESSKRHQKQTNRSTENLPKATETSPVVVSSTPPPVAAPPVPTAPNIGSTTAGGTTSSALASHQTGGGVSAGSQPAPTPLNTSQSSAQNEDWLNSPPNTSRFDPDPVRYSDEPKMAEEAGKAQPTASAAQPSSYTDVFTDLDPLGTGKIKPYIDKKYFFQELKNPPKKVLKDLSGKDSTFNANFASEEQQSQGSQLLAASTLNASNISTLASGSGDLFKANFDEAQAKLSSESHGSMDHGPSSAGPMMETSLVTTSAAGSKNVDLFQEDDDFSKLQLDPFEVHFSRNASPRPGPGSNSCSTARPGPPASDADDTNSGGATRSVEELGEPGKAGPVYNGPLQVNLPPESWASYISQKRLERQTSEANAAQAAVCGGPMARNRPAASSVFKQNTVDVISSLSSSSKKMKPNLFGQKFSKRDSNSINMRRLQESDSLSETETAPEPPPRPDSASHIEPPPLPPKKQFADIVIRPSPRASFGSDRGSGGGTGQRYDYVGSKYESTSRSSPQSAGGPGSDAPPLPLPSRKVGRSAGETIGPGRPQKKSNDEEDYLTPVAGKPDIPTLLPPPQRKDGAKTSRSTTRKQSETDPRNLDEPTPPPTSKSPLGGSFTRDLPAPSSFLPDITLSQLLTLGIDELAGKLNVPVSKLSTMTLVELTTYLSEFIENSKQPAPVKPSQDTASGRDGSVSESPVFKVNFDDANEFVAKFDDNFGEDDRGRDRGAVGPPSFVANFDDLNLQQHPAAGGRVSGGFGTTPAACSSSVVDKYAVFREIIEQDIGAGDEATADESVDREQEPHARLDLQHEVASEMSRLSPAFGAGEGSSPSPSGGQLTSPLAQLPMTKIDTKITEAISHAKDRYAALRDIILVEDLFEKPAPIARMESSSFEDRELELDDGKFEANFDDMIGGSVGTGGSPEINISDAEPTDAGTPDQATTVSGVSLLRTTNATPREDLEIDELMQQAVSNLSLHGTDQQLSPAPTAGGRTQPQGLTVKGSPLLVSHSSTSPYRPPTSTSTTLLNDMIAPKSKSPTYAADTLNLVGKGGVIDTSTSPIPLGQKQQQQQLGMARSPILKPSSHEVAKGMKKKPTPAPRGQSSSEKRSSGSMSDGDDETSPEGGDNNEGGKMSRNTPTNATESWAVFDHPEPPMGQHSSKHRHTDHRHEPRNELARRTCCAHFCPAATRLHIVSPFVGDKNGPESPCSSDAKDEWTKAADLREYGRRWPTKGQTSSSSRDVSPWDEEGPDYRKRPMHGGSSTADMRHHHATSGERYHHPRMPPRRINSNDEEYEDEPMKDQRSGGGVRRRGMKGGAGSRSRDNFEDEHWYHDGGHHPTWSSPTDDDDSRQPTGGGGERGSRSFDRNVYERSTYGPPYEKREPKSLPPYDRREYKNYDKRKYYREREPSRGSGSGGRSSYDYDPYGGDGYGRRSDYDDGYERPGCRDSREAREYFYERDRKSFDRESNESYDSRERRSFGSGDLYGSLDSRAEYRERERDRDRYLSLEKSRSLRRGMRNAGSARLDQELDQDSEGDLMGGGTMGRSSAGGGGGGLRGPDGGVNSLHRSSQNIGGRPGKHQQHHQPMLLDDDVWGVAKGAAPWKRPSSATEQERRYEGVRQRSVGGPGHGGTGSSNLAGSDGEKDRRFRKKSRSRAGERKEQELRSSNYATMRYPLRSKEDYFDFDAVEGGRRGSVGAGVGAALDDDDDDEDDEGGGGGGKGGGMLMLDDPLDDSPAYYGRRQPAGGGAGAGVPYYGKPSTTPRQEGRLVSDALIAQEAKKMSRYEYEEEALRRMKKSNSRDLYFEGSESKYGPGGGYGTVTPPKSASGKHHHGGRMEFEFDEFGDPLPASGGGKFSSNYDPPVGDGFESDFNSPPTMQGTAAGAPSIGSGLLMHGGQKPYRFSNDFSGDKERAHYGGHEPASQGYHHHHRQQAQQQGSHSSHHYKSHSASGYPDPATEYSHSHHSQSSTTSPPPAPPSAPPSGSKLRFNENVTVSKFDAEATTMFEDDFAGRSDTEQDLVEQQQQQQHGWPSATSPGPLVASPAAVATQQTAPASSNNGSNKKILKTSSHPSAHHQHSQQQQHQQQDNIRKSDSINIFAKKADDPFEDDDFFSSQGGGGGRDPFGGAGPPGGGSNDPSAAAAAVPGGWDKNFANFDDNI
ncbi:protein disabled [Anopheles cruzii]|uniref:protein disabled n=1 Tax=Anopheles cruzii TaxID=68878 RepID=UPI0022EC8E7F|nr:protein disabled [Anopheles cruzii]